MIGEGARKLTRVFLSGKSSMRFCVAVIAGLSFSISVILATVGIMDGFDESLRKGLKRTVGDLVLYSARGFFSYEETFTKMVEKYGITEISPTVQTEAFAIYNEQSKGVLVKGVIPEAFSRVTKIPLNINHKEIAVGIELARYLGVQIGDEIVLAFANGNRNFEGMPLLKRYSIKQIIHHGVYLKDVRLIYLNQMSLQGSLDLLGKINSISLNVPVAIKGSNLSERIKKFKFELEDYLDLEFGVRPFWQEYSGLLEAVKIQKLVIAIILQLIVIISIFNVFAFLVYLNEKKSKDIFLFKSLGMSQKMLSRSWMILIFGLWSISCFIAIIFVQFFDILLRNLPIFKLPGDIYHLGELMIVLDLSDYLLVFLSALIWIALVSFFIFYRLRRRSILQGLRREFA